MKIYILLFIVALSSSCASKQAESTNSENTTYKPFQKLDQPAERLAEQAKHEKWKLEREAQLKKLNDLESKRQDAIKKCEADKLKTPIPSNADPDDASKPTLLSCEEQHPPIFERDVVR